MLLLALSFPLLMGAFLLVMQLLESALFPTPPVAGPAEDDVRDEGDDLVDGVQVPLPRDPVTLPDGLRLDVLVARAGVVRGRLDRIPGGLDRPERPLPPGGR